MVESSLILKLNLLVFLFSVNLFAISVLISLKTIAFEEKIDTSKVRVEDASDVNKFCVPLKISDLEENNYITTHHINKNTIICTKDVKKVIMRL